MVATAAQAASNSAGTPEDPAYLDQAWTAGDRSWFYTTSQGSRLLPYAWFLPATMMATQARQLTIAVDLALNHTIHPAREA